MIMFSEGIWTFQMRAELLLEVAGKRWYVFCEAPETTP
jgi:hypothetical protein